MRLVVVWRVTERCDLACGFCAYDRTLRFRRRDADGDEVLRFAALAAGWAAARGREVLFSWLGGEPALWPPLIPVSRALRARGARISLTSNGRILRHLEFAAELDELTLSLDGPPAIHDALRGPGSAAAVLDGLRLLAARSPRPLLRVNTVLMRDNVAAFDELARLVAGADELTFNGLGGRDRPAFHAAHHLRPHDVAAFAARLPALRRELPVAIRGGDGYLARLSASAAGAAMPVDDCRPGDDFWFVDVDGRLSACSHTPGIPIAELADLDDVARRLRARPRAAACDDCPSTQVHRKFA
jgi:MoaA/NifB/PqqE/SkfB family radical SAM enzyme